MIIRKIKLLKSLGLILFAILLFTFSIYNFKNLHFLQEMKVRLLGEKDLIAKMKEYQVKYVPAKIIFFSDKKSKALLSPTWAFRPSHAVPTYPIPLVADADKDGIPEVYIGSFSKQVYVLDGKSGNMLWKWKLPFGEIGGRVMELVDLDDDGNEELIVGTHSTLPIRVYALKTNTKEIDRLLWYKNISGDFLEGGLSVVKINSKEPLIIAASRDAPYSRGSLNLIKKDGAFLYPPIEGLDDCISRPAIGHLTSSQKLSLIHGSHNFYKAQFANRIISRDLTTGMPIWSSQKLGDTGFQNHQILDINFDGKNEVVAFAKDTVTKKERTYLLNGQNGKVMKELSWSSIQGVLKEKQILLVAEKEETVALDKEGVVIYRLPKISFGTNNANGILILFVIKYVNYRMNISTYNSDNGKLISSYNMGLTIPDHPNTSDYGIFGKPSNELSFLTLADTDNDGNWDILVQIKDYVVNIKSPFKVGKNVNPYSPIPYRNIDNSGILYQ